MVKEGKVKVQFWLLLPDTHFICWSVFRRTDIPGQRNILSRSLENLLSGKEVFSEQGKLLEVLKRGIPMAIFARTQTPMSLQLRKFWRKKLSNMVWHINFLLRKDDTKKCFLVDSGKIKEIR